METAVSEATEVKRGRGRPRKPRDETAEPKEKRGRGRPKGSKNKPKGPTREDFAEIVEGGADSLRSAIPAMREKMGIGKLGRPKGKKSGYTMSDKALAQRNEAAKSLKTRLAVTEEDKHYNSCLITHIMRIHEIASHADRSDINTLKSCFVAYLQLCQEDGFNVSNLSAYAAMGFPSPSHFDAFCHSDNPERRELMTLVKSTCSMFRETMVSENKLNPVIGIFWQRNFDGLRNDTEQVQAAREASEDDEFGSSKAYKDKYRNLIGE